MSALDRWKRQILLFENGEKDQQKIGNGRVTVAGAGGLGSSCLYYLVAAGVRNIQLIDPEKVEISNLNRQILYTTDDIGSIKVEVAKKRLRELYPDASIEPVCKRVEDSKEDILGFKPDVIVDCTDNFSARMFLNSVSIKNKIPAVFAMVEGFQGICFPVYPLETACFNCLFETKKTDKNEIPVLGVAPGLAGILEASIALQILLKKRPLFNEMLHFDVENFSFKLIKTRMRRSCSFCGSSRHT